jgi:hypothetical protein
VKLAVSDIGPRLAGSCLQNLSHTITSDLPARCQVQQWARIGQERLLLVLLAKKRHCRIQFIQNHQIAREVCALRQFGRTRSGGQMKRKIAAPFDVQEACGAADCRRGPNRVPATK